MNKKTKTTKRKYTRRAVKSTTPDMRLDVNGGIGIVDISSLVVPEEMKKSINSGHAFINTMFAGDGYVPGTVSMVTGEAGVGKTTFALMALESAGASGHLPYFVSLEENPYQTKRTYDRMGLKRSWPMDPNYIVEDIITNLDAYAARPENKGKKIIAFIDSLPCLTVKMKRGEKLSKEELAIAVISKLVAWAKRTWNVVFFINHVTKSGKFIGKNTLKHIIDCHLNLSWDRQKKSETYGMRLMEQLKNRFGAAGIYFPYKLAARGMVFEGEFGYDDIPNK
jgi:DNA repair protein RadA/Sms